MKLNSTAIEITRNEIIHQYNIKLYEGTDFNNLRLTPYDQLYLYLRDTYPSSAWDDRSVSNLGVSESVAEWLDESLTKWVNLQIDSAHLAQFERSLIHLDRAPVTIIFDNIRDDRVYFIDRGEK